MKKILKIAYYDFKRLLINPITMIVMIVVLISCLITGLSCKIKTSPKYTINIAGTTTQEVYSNFINSTDSDGKKSLQVLVADANAILDYHIEENSQKNSQDALDLQKIDSAFMVIKTNLNKMQNNPSNCIYIEEQNIDEIKNAVNLLSNFVQRYKDYKKFGTDLYFTKTNFSKLENANEFFDENLNKIDITATVNKLFENIEVFDVVKQVEYEVLHFDLEKLETMKSEYITAATNKLDKILLEMKSLKDIVENGDTANKNKMLSLATNYKITAEISKYCVENELNLILNNHFGNLDKLYNFSKINEEETTAALAQAKYLLQDENLYFAQPQQPLNFNTASYEVTAYDHAYYTIAIIGFLDVLFGIFCAYKLFGRDRKNGKMDLILSQNVTFGQVFIGKSLAIVMITSFMLAIYAIALLIFSLMLHPQLAGLIMSTFNLTKAFVIHPFLFLLLKLLTMELEVIFYSIITIFIMNLSRKFNVNFAISIAIFALATICNIFLNGSLVYCLLPFIHANLSSMFASTTMSGGFLVTTIYSHGNFFISLAYYLVMVVLLFLFTKQLFKKN